MGVVPLYPLSGERVIFEPKDVVGRTYGRTYAPARQLMIRGEASFKGGT